MQRRALTRFALDHPVRLGASQKKSFYIHTNDLAGVGFSIDSSAITAQDSQLTVGVRALRGATYTCLTFFFSGNRFSLELRPAAPNPLQTYLARNGASAELLSMQRKVHEPSLPNSSDAPQYPVLCFYVRFRK